MWNAEGGQQIAGMFFLLEGEAGRTGESFIISCNISLYILCSALQSLYLCGGVREVERINEISLGNRKEVHNKDNHDVRDRETLWQWCLIRSWITLWRFQLYLISVISQSVVILYLQRSAAVWELLTCYVIKVLTCRKKILFTAVPTFGQKSKGIEHQSQETPNMKEKSFS